MIFESRVKRRKDGGRAAATGLEIAAGVGTCAAGAMVEATAARVAAPVSEIAVGCTGSESRMGAMGGASAAGREAGAVRAATVGASRADRGSGDGARGKASGGLAVKWTGGEAGAF